MKICPRCNNICDDEDKYCVECKTNIENVKITKRSKMAWSKKNRSRVGCAVIVIAVFVVVVIILLTYGSGKSGFGAGYLDFVRQRHSEKTDVLVSNGFPSHQVFIH